MVKSCTPRSFQYLPFEKKCITMTMLNKDKGKFRWWKVRWKSIIVCPPRFCRLSLLQKKRWNRGGFKITIHRINTLLDLLNIHKNTSVLRCCNFWVVLASSILFSKATTQTVTKTINLTILQDEREYYFATKLFHLFFIFIIS